VIPIDSNGAEAASAGEHGKFTLTAGTTYYYVLGGADASCQSFTLTGYTSAAVVTSGTVQDTNHAELDVTNHSSTAGEWLNEDPTTAFVAVDGTGWSQTNGVIAAAGSGVGGAMFHLGDDGASRTRIAVVVGGTGGVFRGSAWGKE
jgi:hypothetical protein